jgi:hypothetical protein
MRTNDARGRETDDVISFAPGARKEQKERRSGTPLLDTSHRFIEGVPKGPDASTEPARQEGIAFSGGGSKRAGLAGGLVVTSRTTQREGASTRTVGSVLMNRGRRGRPGPEREDQPKAIDSIGVTSERNGA